MGVTIEYKYRVYDLREEDIDAVSKKAGLDEKLDTHDKQLAALGLMYFKMISHMAGVGRIVHDPRKLSEEQKKLLQPSLEAIAKYSSGSLSIDAWQAIVLG